MAHRSSLSRVPVYCQSPTTAPPEHKALLIGINYAHPTGDNEQGYRELKGPVNDAKEMKKALIELFDYKEEGICLMTDEEAHKNTALWPTKENIMHALRDLVRDAYPGDAFVFFYAGHCGQEPTTDVREIDGFNEYIVACDQGIILDDTLREILVDTLPAGTRLTAILDACHSGTLLDLDHYFCHCFLLPQRAQTLQEKNEATRYEGIPPRHHSDDAQHWRDRDAMRLVYRRFSFIATITLVIVRLKIRVVNKRKQLQVEVEVEVVDVDVAALLSPTCMPPWGSPSCINAFPNGPLVISVSSCSDEQSAWEDSQNKGKSMTTELVKILRENPSINVGDLNQQLQRSLTGMAFKRLWEAKSTFKRYSARLSPQQRKMYEDKYTELGVFELKQQTAQFGSLHRLRQEEEFIIKRAHTLDLQLKPLLHPF